MKISDFLLVFITPAIVNFANSAMATEAERRPYLLDPVTVIASPLTSPLGVRLDPSSLTFKSWTALVRCNI
jgi:hypothetical protein